VSFIGTDLTTIIGSIWATFSKPQQLSLGWSQAASSYKLDPSRERGKDC